MNLKFYIDELNANKSVFVNLFSLWNEKNVNWVPSKDKWSVLQIVCHLVDEEKEDFRFRTKFMIENKQPPLPSIDPEGWVQLRKYSDQNFDEKREAFISERNTSIEYLSSLDPESSYWQNSWEHQNFGLLTPSFFLNNWLAHDLLHIKQLTRMRYDFIKADSPQSIEYAGKWT